MSNLWIVTPVYNEEKNLAGFVEEWMAVFRKVVGGDFTFCLLNDGSTDGSLAILNQLAAKYPEIKVIDKPNSGHGRTCVAGYQLAVDAGARWIFNIDADGQCDSAYFETFWKSRGDGRVHYGRRRAREDGWGRRVISKVLSLVIFLLSGEWIRDANVPYRLMSHEDLAFALPRIPHRFRQANAALTFLHHGRPGIIWHDVPFRQRTGRQLPLNIGYFVREAWRFIQDFLCLQWYFNNESPSQKAVMIGKILLVLFAVYYVAAFLILGVSMISAPFAYDWQEGAHLDQIHRCLMGKALYTAPSLEYVPTLYGPLYIYISSIFVFLFGESYTSARLVSFLASIGCGVMLSSLVWKKTHSVFAALLTAGFFYGMFGAVQFYMIIARVDSLYIFLTLVFVYTIWHAVEKGGRYLVFAALTAAAAVLTKQPALLVVFATCFWCLYIKTRRALLAAVLCLAAVAASQLIPSFAGNPWFFYYLYQMPSAHPLTWINVQEFLFRDILRIFSLGLAAVLCAFYFSFREKAGRRDAFLFLMVCCALIVAGALPLIKVWGGPNNLIPLAAAMALGCGLLAGFRLQAKGWISILPIVFLVGFSAQILYGPYDSEKIALAKKIEQESVKIFRNLDEPVFAPCHPHMARLAGKDASAFYAALNDVLLTTGEPGKKLREELRVALEVKRFRSIVLPSYMHVDFPYAQMERYYQRTDPPPDVLVARNYLAIYVPKN